MSAPLRLYGDLADALMVSWLRTWIARRDQRQRQYAYGVRRWAVAEWQRELAAERKAKAGRRESGRDGW